MKLKWLADDTGAVAITFAAALFLFGAFGVLAVDIGSWYGDRREAQTDADLIALAGAQELPRFDDDAGAVADANTAALAWAASNGVDPADVSIEVVDTCFSGSDALHTGVRATVERDTKTFFLSMLPSAVTPTISTSALACSGTPYTMTGMLPFALETAGDCFTPEADWTQRTPLFGQRCDIVVGSSGSDIGQLSFSTDAADACHDSSNSAAEYEENIINGSVVTCGIGQTVSSNPGVNVGKTRTGLRTRLEGDGLCSNNTLRAFPNVQADTANFNMDATLVDLAAPGMGNAGGGVDDFFEVWQPGQDYDLAAPGEHLETIDCDPNTEGVQTSVRNITVIVINDIEVDDGDSCTHCYTVRGFARMYLEGCTVSGNYRADCSQGGGGNTFTIHARFVEAVGLTTGALGLNRYGDVQTFLKQ